MHKQVIVQDIPEVIFPLPPAQEFSAPVYGQVQQVIVGMRPERLVDARVPQRCVRTVPSVTGLPPLPDLCSGDVHDATLVKFLLRQTLLQRKKEEEERRRRKELEQAMKEEKEYEEWQLRLAEAAQAARQLLAERSGPSDASSSSRPTRRKKKRKKKKLPKTSSGPLHRQSWRRSCALQRLVPAVHCVLSVHLRLVDILVVFQRQVPTVPSSPSWCSSGWLCWLRCTSAVFLSIVAGQVLRHLGRYDQKDSCIDMNKVDYAACDAPRAVSFMSVSEHVQGLFCWPFHLAMCSLACLAGPDARHLGSRSTLLFTRPLCATTWPWLRGAENCGFSAVAAHFQGRRLPCRTAEAHPQDQAVQQTIVISLLPYTRWSMSLCTGRADFVVAQRHISMFWTVCRTIVIPQLLYYGYRRPCCAGRTGSSPSLHRGSFHGSNCRLTMDIPSCSTRWPMSWLSWSCRFTFSSWRRGCFLMVRPVWQTIEISQLQYAPGGRCPC